MIPYALSVYDDDEINRVVNVMKEHRTRIGVETEKFEKSIARLFKKKYGVMMNSGSSANLLALNVLNIPKGSEVITPALTFGTTVAPIIQLGLKPVYVDVSGLLIDVNLIEQAITKNTKAILVPYLLGDVPDIKRIKQIANKYNLHLIIDSCDTITPCLDGELVTTSFYGSHIITTGGNGGMAMTDDIKIRDRLRLLRGWGRDENFNFLEIGYNFLPSEMGAAFGNAQLEKLDLLIKKRKENYEELYKFFKPSRNFTVWPHANKLWLAFPLLIHDRSQIELRKYLKRKGIQSRPIMTGDITRQSAFKYEKHYPMADYIGKSGVLIGCHQGLTHQQIQQIKNVFKLFL